MRWRASKTPPDDVPTSGLRTMPPDDGGFAEAVRGMLEGIPTKELGRELHPEERVYRLLLVLRDRYPQAWARERTTERGSSLWEVWRDAATREAETAGAGRRR